MGREPRDSADVSTQKTVVDGPSMSRVPFLVVWNIADDFGAHPIGHLTIRPRGLPGSAGEAASPAMANHSNAQSPRCP